MERLPITTEAWAEKDRLLLRIEMPDGDPYWFNVSEGDGRDFTIEALEDMRVAVLARKDKP